jgi:hypothetical protein
VDQGFLTCPAVLPRASSGGSTLLPIICSW